MGGYSIEMLYQMAYEGAKNAVHDNVTLGAWLVAIATVMIVLTVKFWIDQNSFTRNTIVLAFVAGCAAFFVYQGNLPEKMENIGRELANTAITEGVDQAREAQATELQYIHAVVIEYGEERVECERRVNSKDFCMQNTRYFSEREINVEYKEVCDSDGECETVRTSDTEYTPWFDYVTRYYIVPDTKTKYIHEGVYDMQSAGPDAKPKVFLHEDWRAPENPSDHLYEWLWFSRIGDYNNRIPEFWLRVRTAGETGGDVVVANLVGKYFHWGMADDSTLFQTYEGHYRNLQQLVDLPGPTGVRVPYTNAFGVNAVMRTLLTSKDADIALDYQPVSTIGLNLPTRTVAQFNQRAIEFQGHAGPNKQASVRWFLIADSIVKQLGGINNATTAIKAYLSDQSVWGGFRLPKNLLIMIAVVSDDGTTITGMNLATGMPFGNVLVEQRIRLSVPQDGLPLTVENLMGTFEGHYNATQSNTMSYGYSSMPDAGGSIGILYESTPGWEAPDPDSEECTSAPPEHLGFIRFQMCTQAYRQSTIKIKEDGAKLIEATTIQLAKDRVPLTPAQALLILAIVFVLGTGYMYSRSN